MDQKKKLVIYTGPFVEIYNWPNREQVHKSYRIVKLEKYLISRVENSLNLSAYQFYIISEILRYAHAVLRDIKGNTFYVKNYIN